MQHSVIFSFNKNVDSARASYFFMAAEKLSSISGVLNFKQWKQVSKKNSFEYGISMEFNSEEDYQHYNDHPAHATFIAEQWMPCVADFLEIDFEPMLL